MKRVKSVGTLLFMGYCLIIYLSFYAGDKGLFTFFISMGAAVYLLLLKKFTKKWEVREFGDKSSKNPLK